MRLSITLSVAALVVPVSLAQTLTVIHSFSGNEGSAPRTGLVQASNGHLYGTTPFGGANFNGGTIYRITH